jgi:NADH:ubiquinone oxidoreductase subunit 2 (subunit N)
MSILPFLTVCAAGAFLGLLAQPFHRTARAVGLASLAAALVAAWVVSPGEQVVAGQVRLQTTWFVGFFLTAGLASCLLLCLLGLATGWPERFAPAALATFGGLAVALSAMDPSVALIAAAAAATPGALVAVSPRAGASGASWSSMSGARLASVRLAELRTLALVVVGAMLAAASALLPSWTDDPAPVYALAFLTLGLAVGVRCGVVPFHLPVARLSTTGARLALPLLIVWIPAGLALVALDWTVGTYGIQSDWLTGAIIAIQVLGLATLVLGAIGALLHDELEEIAAYSVVQDAGFIMLALATRADGAGEPLRLWLLAFIVAKTALIAWVAATAWMFGSSHLQDLRGWLRRAPVLGFALLVVVVATLGWPGSAIYEARSTLVRLALPSQLHLLSLLAVVLALAYYGRLFAIGLLSPSERVLAADGERPRQHGREPVPALEPKPTLDLAFELTAVGPRRARAAAPSSLSPPPRKGSLTDLWRLNRGLEASLLVLATALLAAVVAFGGFGASSASRSGTAIDVGPAASETSPGASTSPKPSAAGSPTPAASAAPSQGTSPLPNTTASPSPSDSD